MRLKELLLDQTNLRFFARNRALSARFCTENGMSKDGGGARWSKE
jgi:hypothetical protein